MVTRWQRLVMATLLCSGLGVIQSTADPIGSREDTDVVILDSSALRVVGRANKLLQSVALDTSYIQNRWVDAHVSSEKFLKLASHLAPAYIRIGGTDSDSMLFNETYSPSDRQSRQPTQSYAVPTFYMSGKEWMQINEFAKKAGLKVVLCLNALHRKGSAWDPSNAKELLDFSDKQGYQLDFQLGNEPDIYLYVMNSNLTATEHAQDFTVLRSLLDTYPRYKDSLLVGPDIYSFEPYLQEFLETQKNAVSVVSFHHYYLDGSIAEVPDFYNTSVLNSLVSYINTRKKIVTDTNTRAPVWLSETSSSMKGGATNISDRFVDGFTWLDKLAIAPKLGVDVVCRQDIYGNKYGLLNIDTLDPNPDWWLSVLYKKLVGVGVLNTTIPTGSVRLYAHCSRTSPGYVVLFGMNVNSKDVSVQLKGSESALEKDKAAAYILTGEHGLLSQTVLLNGKRLELNKDYSLPPLEPEMVAASPLHLPAFSLVFFVLEDIKVAACKEI